MSTKVRAVYDGEVFKPIESLELPPDTEVELTIIECSTEKNHDAGEEYSFIRTALELAIDEGPTDWSTRYEEYLYPYPPKSRRGDEE
jgi:predicted DNA-binding antitoxin AbrB/MazE fold protein